jgi:nucleotide-binding universal stress UspA family protein
LIRIKKALLHLDREAGCRSVLEVALRLGRREGTEFHALRVLRELPWYARLGSREVGALRRAMVAEAEAEVERDVRRLRQAGLRVRSSVAWGRPYEVIVREVLRRRSDLVLQPGQRAEAGEPRLDSTAMHLFRNCPAPVWVVQPGRSRVRRVLAAVDPRAPEEDRNDLGARIIEYARTLAEHEGAEWSVLHAYRIPGEQTLRGRVPARQYATYLSQATDAVRNSMEELLAPFGLPPDDKRVRLIKGEPSQVIPRLVQREKIDLLVLGSTGRSGIPGFLIGNTAERVLSAVSCSVLVLKPPGFVSPVKPER